MRLRTAALILALTLGAGGLLALFGSFFYAQRQVRRGLPVGERREANLWIAGGLLAWVGLGLLVNGAAREAAEDQGARLMLLVAGVLLVTLAVAAGFRLRRIVLSLRAREATREGATLRPPS